MPHAERDPEAIRLGATIRALRLAHGLQQNELARAIGVSQPYMANIEAGVKKAPLRLCRKVADTFRVPLAAITITGYEAVTEPAAAVQP